MRSRYGKCRSCGALMQWAETAPTKKKPAGRMPLDITRRADGNVKLVWQRLYDEPLATVLGPAQLADERAAHAAAFEQGLTDEPELLLWVSHFATCPNAAKHRKRRRAA